MRWSLLRAAELRCDRIGLAGAARRERAKRIPEDPREDLPRPQPCIIKTAASHVTENTVEQELVREDRTGLRAGWSWR